MRPSVETTPSTTPEVMENYLSEEDLAALAKALAHPARIKIIRLLLSKKTCIGGDIVEDIGLAQSTVSEHLRILKASGIITGEITRPRVCYTLNPSRLRPMAGLLNLVFNNDAQDDDTLNCWVSSVTNQQHS